MVEEFDPLKYWNDRHRRTHGLSGVGYLGLKGYNDWMYRVRKQVFRRLLSRYGDRLIGARVLDVGSGTGFYLEEWKRQQVKELVGTDFSTVAVGRLRNAFSDVAIEQLDIATADTAELLKFGRFDFISIIDVLFHIVDDASYQRAFRNLALLLKPDGHLLFTENFLDAARRSGGAWQALRGLSDVEAAVSNAGLRIEVRKPLFVLMNNPINSQSRLLKHSWALMQKISMRSWIAGFAMGAAMYPVELLLTRALMDSPTTEIAVAGHVSR